MSGVAIGSPDPVGAGFTPARAEEQGQVAPETKRPKRRRIRLARALYEVTGQPMLVTICTRNRQAVLTGKQMSEVIEAALKSASKSSPMDVFAWCVMPDHLHAVVAASDGGDVVEWVRRFKGRVAAAARGMGSRALWQRSFHDHVLRADEAVAEALKYVLANPVRANLVEDWRDWPHRGSLTWDLSEWVDL